MGTAMSPDSAASPFASKSDAELSALEKDRSLSPSDWQAVIDEMERRKRRETSAPSYAPPPPAAGASAASSGAAAPAVQADSRIAAAIAQLRALLVPGETLQAVAVQRRLFALTHRRMLVAATSGRFIAIARGLLGGYTPVDIRWQDIEDAKLRVGIFGADLAVSSLNKQDLASAGHLAGAVAVMGLRKDEAQGVYRIAQAQEQAWREKRRVRDLDELRARSGGIQFGAGGAGAPAAGGASDGGDPATRLQRAKEMLDAGLITDSEYESIKAKIIDRL
jgi:hypothetical protein